MAMRLEHAISMLRWMSPSSKLKTAFGGSSSHHANLFKPLPERPFSAPSRVRMARQSLSLAPGTAFVLPPVPVAPGTYFCTPVIGPSLGKKSNELHLKRGLTAKASRFYWFIIRALYNVHRPPVRGKGRPVSLRGSGNSQGDIGGQRQRETRKDILPHYNTNNRSLLLQQGQRRR